MNLRQTFPFAMFIAGVTMMGCSSSSETISPNQAGEVEILEYCAGDKYKSLTKTTFEQRQLGKA